MSLAAGYRSQPDTVVRAEFEGVSSALRQCECMGLAAGYRPQSDTVERAELKGVSPASCQFEFMGLASGRRPQPVIVGVYVDDICVVEGDTITVLDIHSAISPSPFFRVCFDPAMSEAPCPFRGGVGEFGRPGVIGRSLGG